MIPRLPRFVGSFLLSVFAVNSAVAATAEDAASPDVLQDIVVTGVRASLEKSLEIKRDAPVILDSINATELGRFPDADVADSLEHLPGITISRTTGGEGIKVNVRGFGPQYNVVTLNNRLLATDDDARDLAFDVLPSEVIAGADVLKTFSASTIEGSIGGTVNLRTASPFDTPGLHAGVHAEGSYNEMSQLPGQRYSAVVSNTFHDGTLGFQLGLVHSDNKLRTDTLGNNNQSIYGPSQYPFDAASGGVSLVSTPCCISFGSIYDEKKRDAVSGSLEWRPSETFKLVLDGLYTHLDDPQHGYYQSYYFPYSTDALGNPLWSNPSIANGVVTGVTSSEFQPEAVNNTINRKVDTELVGLKGTWDVSSSLQLTTDVYHSRADRPEGGTDNYVTAGLVAPGSVGPDTLIFQDQPNGLPSINVLVPPSQLGLAACPGNTASPGHPGSCSYTALINSRYLNNNQFWSTHYDELNGYSITDQIDSGQLEGKLKVGWGPLTQLRFGFMQTNREKARVDSNNDWTNGSGQYGSLYLTYPGVQNGPYSFGSQGYNVFSLQTPPNWMRGSGGSFPNALPVINVSQLLSFLKSLNGLTNPYTGTPFNFADSLPQTDPFNSYQVAEKTSSLYLQADFNQSDRWSGNAGVRIVHTQTTAKYARSVPISVWTPNINASTVVYNVDYLTSQEQQSEASYTFALPAFNAAFWIIPQEVQLRGGLSETIARPNLNQLAPNATNQAIGGRPIINYTGTVGLKPIKSYNIDLSLEYYYHPHASLAVALFDKEVHDDIYVGSTSNVDLGTHLYVGGAPGSPGVTQVKNFLWTVYAPANGARSRYTGVELSWQHILDNGFGAHFQTTYTRSNSYDQNGNSTGPVNAVPPTTASLSVLYEKNPLSLAVNYDWTSSYRQECSQCTEVPGWPVYSDHFGWMTAALHYHVTSNLDVYVEGKNLTDAVARSYLNGNRLLVWANGEATGQSSSGVGAGYTAYGRSYALGAAYHF